jgi:hypothetical protein
MFPDLAQLKPRTDPSISQLIGWVRHKQPFIFSKQGDGEIAAMSGESGQNCDGQNYTPALGRALTMAYAKFERLHQVYDRVMVIPWNYPLNILHHDNTDIAAVRDLWIAVVESMQPKVFIGPAHLARAATFLRARHIQVPAQRAFDQDDQVRKALWSEWKAGAMFIFSAGPAAKVWEAEVASSAVTVIDAGSAFDPLFHGCTRTHQLPRAQLEKMYADYLKV